MRKNFDKLESLYYKELIKTGDSIEETVFMQNDHFFDIFNRKPVFNILSLLHIPYTIDNNSLYINRLKVTYINGISPYTALSKYSDYYTIDYESSKTEILKYPEMRGDSVCKEDKDFIGKDEVYFKINDFSTFNINRLLENQGKKLFLDLRDNGGGNLAQMLSLLEVFIKGELFYLYNKSRKLIVTAKNELLVPFKQVIVLVNNQTASAAEFFAKTLKNHINCTIVGEKTYGKWVAHTVVKMEGYYIKIPIYKYKNISGKDEKILSGIQPDLYFCTAQEYTDYLKYNGIFL